MSEESLDVLIYVSSKNKDIDEAIKLWIENFKYILETSLSQVLKRKAHCEKKYEEEEIVNSKVYLQVNLYNNTESIVQKRSDIDNANIIYINCSNELAVDPRSKYYNFYDSQSNKIDDLTSNIQNIKNSVWIKISDLSFEIRNKLKTNKDKEQKTSNKTIFFAETSPDQNKNRDYLIREFRHRGYGILPLGQMSNDMLNFSEEVQKCMSDSIISIHLVGNHYAPLLNNIEVSKVELQNDIFSEVIATTNKDLTRLVLISPGIKPRSEKQKKYIESFKRNIELHKNTEIIQTPLEDFKTIILKRIDPQLSETEEKIINSSSVPNKSIYLIKDKTEIKGFDTIQKAIQDAGFDVIETKWRSNKIELIKQHQWNLVNSDGVIISYNSNNIQWLNSKLTDIVKSPGIGRKKPFKFKILFTNSNIDNLNIRISDLEIINSNDSKSIKFVLDKIK